MEIANQKIGAVLPPRWTLSPPKLKLSLVPSHPTPLRKDFIMLELEIIIDFLIYIPMLTLVVLVYILLCKVQKYRDEVEYLRSVCEQAIQISKQNEKSLKNNTIKKSAATSNLL